MRSRDAGPERAAAEMEERDADAQIAKARAEEAAIADEFSRRTEELSASYATALAKAQELLDAGDSPGPAADGVARAHRDVLRVFRKALEAELQVWRAEIDRLGAWADRARAEVKDQISRRMRVDELRKAHERVQAKLQDLGTGDPMDHSSESDPGGPREPFKVQT
jgi:hypothetical protein